MYECTIYLLLSFSTLSISSSPLPHPVRICFFSWLLICRITANHCFLWHFALCCLQHPSLLCCISSSEIHLLKSTLLKLSPFPTFHLHVYSSWKLFPFLLHTSSLPIPSTPPIVRTVPSLSYSRAITWILFGASQGPPNYTLQLHHPSKIQFC